MNPKRPIIESYIAWLTIAALAADILFLLTRDISGPLSRRFSRDSSMLIKEIADMERTWLNA